MGIVTLNNTFFLFVLLLYRTVLFGEYKCWGPGSKSSERVKYSKQLSYEEVEPFVSLGYVQSEKWLLPPPNPEI